MDIKDFILIGGGLLIAAVVAHGFWIAWRARRDPLKIDLVTELSGEPGEDDGDDLRHLRGELPNGGARVVGRPEPRQESLSLGEEPVEPEPAPVRGGGRGERRMEPRLDRSSRAEPRLDARAQPRVEPRSESAAELAAESLDVPAERAPSRPAPEPRARGDSERGTEPEAAAAPGAASGRRDARRRVADVIMPDRSPRTEEPREPKRWAVRKAPAEREPQGDRAAGPRDADPREQPTPRTRTERPVRGGVQSGEPRKAEPVVEELIMISVVAPRGTPFTGGGLVEALRNRGLRYGDMNIFHRLEPMTRETLYSVANVVEPGTFDLADLDNFRSPGVCFFMKLPGPEQPLDVFEDMLKVARDVAVRMGGELKDEQRSVMTGQTVEHYRQRISDFCRRRMSMRA